jgi:hypothetical protein
MLAVVRVSDKQERKIVSYEFLYWCSGELKKARVNGTIHRSGTGDFVHRSIRDDALEKVKRGSNPSYIG